MVQLTRIYTRGGDQGKTSLGNGERIKKTDIRVEVIGSVDEVNSFVGVAVLFVEDSAVLNLLQLIQNNLFDIGADLCLPENDDQLDYKPLRINPEQTAYLEKMIDYYNKDLSPLKSFILPGGTKGSSFLHLARSVTRRAERLLCHLKEEVSEKDACILDVLAYMNRLSDLFFVLCRYLNDKGEGDILWEPGKGRGA
jgi:cob(I)alamin adenosyltransferase